MELVVRKSDLLRELQLFQGIVERNTTIPVLANVLMEAEGKELRFLATDLHVALRSHCSASVAKGGRLTLPAKKFFEIIRFLPETDVRIEQDKSGVKVAADRFDSHIQTMPADEFPSLPSGTGQAGLTLRAELLRQMLARTQFATTSDDTRYFLNGVLMVARPGRVADYYHIRPNDLKQRNNSKSIAQPRQMAMYMCRQLTSKSLPEIGRAFGGKHHTTVMHSINTVEEKMRKDRDFHNLVHNLLNGLR